MLTILSCEILIEQSMFDVINGRQMGVGNKGVGIMGVGVMGCNPER